MNTERQEMETMMSYLKTKRYRLNWNDGTSQIVVGVSAEDAFKDAGFGEIHLSNLNNYEVIN